MSARRYLGIDQGTTATKAVLLDEAGSVTEIYEAAHAQHHPQPGWVEHDAEELLAHIEAAIHAAGPVAAIGIANQGETIIAFDRATGRPLHNAIVWLDNRTSAALESIPVAQARQVHRRTGLPLDSYFSASKLRWLLDHVPEAAELHKAGRLCLGTSDAFFLFRLTGNFFTDASTASRTSLLHLKRRQWDPELCGVFSVPIETLPEIRATAFGTLPNGTPVTASLVDQQAALWAHGCRRPGDLKFTFGTGGFALALTGTKPVLDRASGLLPTIAWASGTAADYALDGGIYNAASALDWARGIGLFENYDGIAEFTGPSALERGLIFVPALSGLACPHWDRDAAGLFIGMGLHTSREDMIRAVIEGVALSAAEVLDAFNRLVPLAETLSVDGGLTRNAYFCRMLATLTGRQVRVLEGEVAAVGAAWMARDGRGYTGTEPRLASRLYLPGPPIDPALKSRFAAAVQRAKNWRA